MSIFLDAYWGPGYYMYPTVKAQQAAGEAARDSRRAIDAGKRAEERLDRLLLVNEALWQLLKEKLEVIDEELIAKVREVDLSDGKLDGKITRAVRECAACKRKISQRHQRCLYCGATTDGPPFGAV